MNHNNFILSPLSRILEDLTIATAGIYGIETYPLCEYLMQSSFLRMTGAQEQKMKCICWELATNDYEYRYERFRKNPVGECSSYKEKTIVYKDLIGQIQKFDENFDVGTLLNNSRILQETQNASLT